LNVYALQEVDSFNIFAIIISTEFSFLTAVNIESDESSEQRSNVEILLKEIYNNKRAF